MAVSYSSMDYPGTLAFHSATLECSFATRRHSLPEIPASDALSSFLKDINSNKVCPGLLIWIKTVCSRLSGLLKRLQNESLCFLQLKDFIRECHIVLRLPSTFTAACRRAVLNRVRC